MIELIIATITGCSDDLDSRCHQTHCRMIRCILSLTTLVSLELDLRGIRCSKNDTSHIQSTSASAFMHAYSFHHCRPPTSEHAELAVLGSSGAALKQHARERLDYDIRKLDVQTMSAALRISHRTAPALPRVLQATVRSRDGNVPQYCPSANGHFNVSSATERCRYPSAYHARLLEKSVQIVIRVSCRFARFPRKAPCNHLPGLVETNCETDTKPYWNMDC